ncbi:MAG: hypothetical protein HYZ73_08870, partial [Elusimicrobia bacterium]|nr:hypothetical protein [Elusimicrobiota bacterium]
MKRLGNVCLMRRWIRSTACGTAVVFFYSNVIAPPLAQANFWEERRQAVQALRPSHVPPTHPAWPVLAQLPSPQAQLATLTPAHPVPPLIAPRPSPLRGRGQGEGAGVHRSQPLPEWLNRVVAPYGTVQELWLPTDRPRRLILHLQDAHDHLEAQQNIAALIETFSHQGLRLVGLEGAKGPVNFAPYRAFPNPQVTKDLAAHFLNIRWISGPEYAGLTMSDPLPFVGLEDASLYRAHVEAYRDAYAAAQQAKALHEQWFQRTQALKRQMYPPTLLKLDELITKYHQGTLPLTTYVTALTESTPTPSLFPQYPQLAWFLQALTLEQSLNFTQVEAERRRVIEALVTHSATQGVQELTQLSVAFRMGQLSASRYYAALRHFCERQGVSLQRYPQFARYLHYVLLVDQIQHEPLFAEFERLEQERVNAYLTTPALQQLHAASQDLLRVGKLLTQTFTSAEWVKYTQRRVYILALPERLATLAKTIGVPLLGSLSPLRERVGVREDFWTDLLIRCEAFYRLATQRNEALVNHLQETWKDLPPLRTGSELGPSTVPELAIVVAGGFHTEGLTQLLKQHRLPFAVITPRISKMEGDHDYLEVFRRDKTPLEKLFTGERLTIKSQGNIAFIPGLDDLPHQGDGVAVFNAYTALGQLGGNAALPGTLQKVVTASQQLGVTLNEVASYPVGQDGSVLTGQIRLNKTTLLPFKVLIGNVPALQRKRTLANVYGPSFQTFPCNGAQITIGLRNPSLSDSLTFASKRLALAVQSPLHGITTNLVGAGSLEALWQFFQSLPWWGWVIFIVILFIPRIIQTIQRQREKNRYAKQLEDNYGITLEIAKSLIKFIYDTKQEKTLRALGGALQYPQIIPMFMEGLNDLSLEVFVGSARGLGLICGPEYIPV